MATALTVEGRDKVSRHLLGDSATTYPGTGQCWLSLHSAQPGNAGASQISASRVACALSYDAGNKWFTNASAISVPSVSGSVQWVALWHSAGTGNVWFEGQLPAPVSISGTHSVIIPANSLRIYNALPDGSNKGGITDKGAELVLGHFLGVASWTMPTSFTERTHSANATRTGGVSVLNGSVYTTANAFTYASGNLFQGNATQSVGYSGNSKYWSVTDASGNPLVFGECATGEQAWVNYNGDGYSTAGVDASGVDDYNDSAGGHTFTRTSLRVAFDIQSGIVNGDVNSGTGTTTMSLSGTLTPSLRSGTLTGSMTLTGIISVGSTSVARGIATFSLYGQIGDSVPGSVFAYETPLYPCVATLQIHESS